jgi:hypothetical protein
MDAEDLTPLPSFPILSEEESIKQIHADMHRVCNLEIKRLNAKITTLTAKLEEAEKERKELLSMCERQMNLLTGAAKPRVQLVEEHEETKLELSSLQAICLKQGEAFEKVLGEYESYFVDWERMSNEKGYKPEYSKAFLEARDALSQPQSLDALREFASEAINALEKAQQRHRLQHAHNPTEFDTMETPYDEVLRHYANILPEKKG